MWRRTSQVQKQKTPPWVLFACSFQLSGRVMGNNKTCFGSEEVCS